MNKFVTVDNHDYIRENYFIKTKQLELAEEKRDIIFDISEKKSNQIFGTVELAVTSEKQILIVKCSNLYSTSKIKERQKRNELNHGIGTKLFVDDIGMIEINAIEIVITDLNVERINKLMHIFDEIEEHNTEKETYEPGI